MSSKHPKVETFATLSAQNDEMRKAMAQMQLQAQTALQMAAEERGKYLHILKLFAAVVAQNMQEGKKTVVLHKTLVDQPDTLNLARDDEEGGYGYRLLTQEDLEKLAHEAEGASEGSGSGEPPVADPESGDGV